MESARESRLAMSRKRFQRGQLLRKGDNWLGRWREDVADDTGTIQRIHKKEVLGSIAEFPTKRLALRELERRLEPINNVDYRPTRKVTFAVFTERWMEQVLVHQKPSSQSSARSHIRVHLLPAFGEMYLGDIRMEKVQQWVTEADKSPKMVKNVIVTLMSMWNTAQAWEYVQHNPFPRGASGRLLLRFPTARPGATYHFTLEEAVGIIAKAKGKWKTFFRILAETGMRPGELAGLRACDVRERQITVAQSVWNQKVQTPKTSNAVRTFAISASLAQEIQERIEGRNDAELLFTTETGRPLSMDNFRHRVLGPILKELGIDKKLEALGIARCGNYAFRHMNATLMDAINTPMKTRQKRLGHAQIETTLKHYTHAMDADDRIAADRIGALLASHTEGARVQ